MAETKNQKTSTVDVQANDEIGRDISYDMWKRGMAAPDEAQQPRETRSIFRFS